MKKAISKQLISMLLSIVLMFCFAPCGKAATQRLSVESKSANPGESVDIAIAIEGNPGLYAFTLDVLYDTSKLAYQYHQMDDPFSKATVNSTDGKLRLIWLADSTDNYTGNASVLSLKLKVKPDASGDAFVSAQFSECIDTDFSDISFAPGHGTVAISSKSSTNSDKTKFDSDQSYDDVGFFPVLISSTSSTSTSHRNDSFTNAFVDQNGVLWMWGLNDCGQLGNGSTKKSNIPVKVMEDVASVAISPKVSAAIKTDGTLWTWGSNANGTLGNGGLGNETQSLEYRGTKYQVPMQTLPKKILDNVKNVHLNGNICAAIRTDNSLWIWGKGYLGNADFGNSTTYSGDSMQTVPVKLMDNVEFISLDEHFSAAIKSDRSLWMWGWGYASCLGLGYWRGSTEPVKVMDDVAFVHAGDCFGNSYANAIKTDETLWTWGSNRYGQLGNGGTGTGCYCGGKFKCQSYPEQVMKDIAVVISDKERCVAIGKDGSLWAWGDEPRGGEATSRSTPSKAAENVASVSIRGEITAAVMTDGSCWYWGDIYEKPQKIADNVLCADAGASCIVLKDGTLWKWSAKSNNPLLHGVEIFRINDVFKPFLQDNSPNKSSISLY